MQNPKIFKKLLFLAMFISSFNMHSCVQHASDENTLGFIDFSADDTIPPVITLLGDNPCHILVGSSYSEPGATAYDSNDGDITSQIVIDNSSVNTSEKGVYYVTYTVSDSAGNEAEKERRVNIVSIIDSVPPEMILLGDNPMELNVGDEYSEPGATAEDNIDGDLTKAIIIDDDEVNTSKKGIYRVYYAVSDAAGNETNKTRVVPVGDVADTIAPVVTIKGPNPLTLFIGDTYTEHGASAVDNFDGDITDKIETIGTVNTSATGTNGILYQVTDSQGNKGSATRTVNVVSPGTPVITLKGDNPMNLLVGGTYVEPGATANDAEDGDLTVSIVITGTVNTSTAGTYTVTYTVTDKDDNTGSATRTVNVVSSGTPVITMEGDNPMDLAVGDTYVEPGATAYDAEDGDLTGSIEIIGTVNTSIAGTYGVLYQVTDSDDNKGSATRTVNVISSEKPVITLKGNNPMTLSVGDTYVEPGATANDVEDGDLTSSIVISGTVNTSTAGTYAITYTVSDKDNNTASATRTVKVKGPGKPVLTLNGDNPMVLFVGDTYVEPGATATDPEDGDLTDSIKIGTDVYTSIVGSFETFYLVTDSDSNEAFARRIVCVGTGEVIIIEKSDNDVTIFDVPSETTFLITDLDFLGGAPQIDLIFSAGDGSYYIEGGTVTQYEANSPWLYEEIPDDRDVTFVITPTNATKVKFHWHR